MDITLEKKLQGFQLVAQEKVLSPAETERPGPSLLTLLNMNNSISATGHSVLHPREEGADSGASPDQAPGTCLHCVLVKVGLEAMMRKHSLIRD